MVGLGELGRVHRVDKRKKIGTQEVALTSEFKGAMYAINPLGLRRPLLRQKFIGICGSRCSWGKEE